MINPFANRKISTGAWLSAAVALILAGCVQSGSGYGSTAPAVGYSSPDPYHYRCTGNCQAGE
jgi:hypothetical protein